MMHTSSIEFLKQRNVYGFRCQVSGVRKQKTEVRRQRTNLNAEGGMRPYPYLAAEHIFDNRSIHDIIHTWPNSKTAI